MIAKVHGFFCLLLSLTACQLSPVKSYLVEPTVANIAEQFVDAYNAHDQQAMLKLVHPEIKYMYIDANQIYTETNSKAALVDFLMTYFANNSKAQSKLLSSHLQGPFIHQVEQALWLDASGQQKSQCSLSVYEIKQKLIINIWYFTTFECPTA